MNRLSEGPGGGGLGGSHEGSNHGSSSDSRGRQPHEQHEQHQLHQQHRQNENGETETDCDAQVLEPLLSSWQIGVGAPISPPSSPSNPSDPLNPLQKLPMDQSYPHHHQQHQHQQRQQPQSQHQLNQQLHQQHEQYQRQRRRSSLMASLPTFHSLRNINESLNSTVNSTASTVSTVCNSLNNLSELSETFSASTTGKSSIRESLLRLDSSHRLSVTCSGSDLSQLYLSSPERLLSDIGGAGGVDGVGSVGNGSAGHKFRRRQSWLQAADLYGQRTSFRRRSSYARFLDGDFMSEIREWEEESGESVLEIEEEEHGSKLLCSKSGSLWSKCTRSCFKRQFAKNTSTLTKCTDIPKLICNLFHCPHFPLLIVPLMMLLDLLLGVSLSLYDSHLLRNVPHFHFPLCYAWVQKGTNAVTSLVLLCLTRRMEWREWREAQEQLRIETNPNFRQLHSPLKPQCPSNPSNSLNPSSSGKDFKELTPLTSPTPITPLTPITTLTPLPSLQTFRRHKLPLTAISLVQTISAAFANRSLQDIPLPLFKVVLMCGPIFVALLTSLVEGRAYSKTRWVALALIGMGAMRAVYAEAEGAENPRIIMEGAGFALGASAFSGMSLVLSSVLMHGGGGHESSENKLVNGNRVEETWEKQVDQEREKLLRPPNGNSTSDKVPTVPTVPASEHDVVEELNPLSLLFYLSCTQVFLLTLYLSPWEAFGSFMVFFGEEEDEVDMGQLGQFRQGGQGGQGEVEEEPVVQGEFVEFTYYFMDNPWVATMYLMIGSSMALCLAVLTFVLVNRTSPVAASLLGNVRSIATVAVSSMLLEKANERIVAGNGDEAGGGLFGSATFGYTLTLAGGVAYAMAALKRESS